MILPKLSGLDVLRLLKEDVLTRHIPVIVLTGLSQTNEEKLVKDGAAGMLVKSEEMLSDGPGGLVDSVKKVLAQIKK